MLNKGVWGSMAPIEGSVLCLGGGLGKDFDH